jgi:hypothetical protein
MIWMIFNLPEDLDDESFVEFSGMVFTVHLARNHTSMNTDPMVTPDP